MDVLDDLEDITLDTPDAPEVRESVFILLQKIYFSVLYTVVPVGAVIEDSAANTVQRFNVGIYY